MARSKRRHRMPFGVEETDGGHRRFRLWAPGAQRVELCLNGNGDACHVSIPMHSEADRCLDDRADVRLALELIGVEQRVGCVALQDGRELPDEVRRVTHPGAHPLTEERRHLVRRVTGEEDAT